jgi:hypothetical protein
VLTQPLKQPTIEQHTLTHGRVHTLDLRTMAQADVPEDWLQRCVDLGVGTERTAFDRRCLPRPIISLSHLLNRSENRQQSSRAVAVQRRPTFVLTAARESELKLRISEVGVVPVCRVGRFPAA